MIETLLKGWQSRLKYEYVVHAKNPLDMWSIIINSSGETGLFYKNKKYSYKDFKYIKKHELEPKFKMEEEIKSKKK